MRIIAVANQKGGCGKTTTSINFAACLHFLQKQVLLIDVDPQGHSTCGLSIKTHKGMLTLYEFLSPLQHIAQPFSQVVKTLQPNFDLIPCDSNLNALEEEFSFIPNHYIVLKNLLSRIATEYKKYDFVILDCPPNLGVLTWNALTAADEVLIPIEPSFFSLHGLAKISETIQVVNQNREIPLVVHALLTLFNSQANFSQEIYEEVQAHFQNRLFHTIVHEHITLKEAAAAGQSIIQFAPQSAAFQDYLNLAVEYLEREWDRKLPQKDLGWDHFVENFFGPRSVSDGVLFQFLSKTASTVEIAGDFNHWIPEPLIRRSQDGLWQKVIAMNLRKFRYKFIVDGEWQVDPHQPKQKVNAYGGMDSVMELAS